MVLFAVGLALGVSGCSSFDIEGLRPLVAVNGDRAGTELEELLTEAAEHYRAGHYGLAVNAYQVALGHNDESVRALNGAAASYDRLGRFDLAERNYLRALAVEPDSARTLNNLGYSMLLRERPNAALEYFARAKELDPENTTVEANVELAQSEIERLERHSGLAKAPVDMVEETSTVPSMWVERTDARTLTLVTKPDPRLLEMAAETGLHPRWFSLGGEFIEAAVARNVEVAAARRDHGPTHLLAEADLMLIAP